MHRHHLGIQFGGVCHRSLRSNTGRHVLILNHHLLVALHSPETEIAGGTGELGRHLGIHFTDIETLVPKHHRVKLLQRLVGLLGLDT